MYSGLKRLSNIITVLFAISVCYSIIFSISIYYNLLIDFKEFFFTYSYLFFIPIVFLSMEVAIKKTVEIIIARDLAMYERFKEIEEKLK